MVNSRVKDERTVSFPQRHKLLFSTSQPNNRPITDSPEEPNVLLWRKKTKLFSTSFLCKLLHWIQELPTCCWLLCMPAALPAPVSPDAAVQEWIGSSSGWDGLDGLSLSAHQSQPGSNLTPMPPGLSGKPGENYWPVKKTNKCFVYVHMLCMADSSEGIDTAGDEFWLNWKC